MANEAVHDAEKQEGSDDSLANGRDGEHETPYEAAAEAEANEKPKAPPFAMMEVPDGGIKAWTQVICGFFLFFNTWFVSSLLPSVRSKLRRTDPD